MNKQKITRFTIKTEEFGILRKEAPVSLCSALIENGFIDNLHYGSNILKYNKPVSDSVVFSASFKVDGDFYVKKHLVLRLSGIDTFCTVRLNGCDVGTVSSIFSVFERDVKELVKLGENELTLTFTDYAQRCAAPRDAGIFGEVELVGYDKCAIGNIAISQQHTDGVVTMSLAMDLIGESDGARAVATLVSPTGQVYYSGLMGGKCEIRIPDANLWWPWGVGVQNLYKLTVNLYFDGEVEDSWEHSVGFRDANVLAKESGELLLELNGINVLPFGAEYFSEDSILPRISRERTERLLSDARAANLNLIKIGIGDSPLPEWVFDICDRLGIIVWLYVSEPYDEKKSREICELLCRVAHHTSFLLVSVTDHKGIIESFARERLPSVLTLPSECPETLIALDFPSVPSVKTLSSVASSDNINPASFEIECHGSEDEGISRMLAAVVKRYRIPTALSELSYVSQIVAAEEISDAFSDARAQRNRLSVIHGRLNDSCPAVSSSSIDYYGRWKALHYLSRKFCAPVLVSAKGEGGRVTLNVSNERRFSLTGELTYSVLDSENRMIMTESVSLKCDAFSSCEAVTLDLSDVVFGRERDCYLNFSLSSDTEKDLSFGTYLFTKPKYFNYKKPNFKTEITGSGNTFALVISADCFASRVCLDFADADAVFEDNFFDITSSSPLRISFVTEDTESIEKLRRGLCIKTIYDIGKII